jgi:sulfatase maturation enzyme AslB (radical SAM superfamily)
MSDEVLECHIRDYIASVTADEVAFTWRGGGPTFDTTTAIELLRTPIANAESMQASPRTDAAASSTDPRLPTGPVPLEDR